MAQSLRLGQTSPGKSYTMDGHNIEDKQYQGGGPRMVWSIFEGICHADEHIEFLVMMSIVKIYNDSRKVYADKARGAFIGEITDCYVGCESERFDVMQKRQCIRSMAIALRLHAQE